MATLTLWVDETIPSALSPNGDRAHWAQLSRGRAAFREACAHRIRNELRNPERRGLMREIRASATPLPWRRARVSVAAYFASLRPGTLHAAYRPEDVPNLVYALKPLYDALVDAEVIEDDNAGQMVLGDHEILPAPSFVAEGFLVTVESLP